MQFPPAAAERTVIACLQPIARPTTFLSWRPADAQLLVGSGGRRQSPLAAEADLRFGAALLSWVSPISALVAARHENSPFSCEPDRLRRAPGTAGYCRADRGWPHPRHPSK